MPRFTKPELEEFVALDKQRRDLESKATAIRQKMEPVRKKVKELLESRNWEPCQRHGFQLTAINCGADVSWRQQFIDLAGLEAAEKIKADAPQRKRVEVRA